MPSLRSTLPVVLLSLAVPAATTPLDAQTPERHSVAGDQVVIYNIAGTATLEAGSGANVVVEVTRRGSDAGQLRIERREVDGRSGLIVRYPDEDVVYESERWNGRTDLRVREDGTFFGRGDAGERIRVKSSGSGTEAHADLRVLVPAGKTVYLRLGVGSVSASNIQGGLDIDVASAGVQTSNTRGALRIDTGSGAVRVTQAEGDVIVDTGSGGIQLTGVRGESVMLDTGSGSVTASDVSSGSLEVDTGSGSIRLSAVAAHDVTLDTGSGSVELELTSDVDRLRIDTGSGGVRLGVPANLGASLEAETGSGGITLDLPVTVTRQSRDHVVGRIGDGRGTIEIDTGSGSIRIRQR